MGFLDKARAAANDLAQKADTALANSNLGGPGGGGADRYLRDLGVITYLESKGEAVPTEERLRVMGAISEMERNGTLGALTLRTSAAGVGDVPPPPGAAGPVPGAASSGEVPPMPASDPAPQSPTPPTAPPPPPPTWAKNDES